MTPPREPRAPASAGVWRPGPGGGRPPGPPRQCLELIAKHDMVLATGHIRPDEVPPVVQAAREVGVQRIVVTHPEFPTTKLTIEQQQALARQGVYFERCFTTPHTAKCSWEYLIENIRQVGVASTILATDLGQTTNPHVDEGLAIYYGQLLDAGFSEADVRQMGTT